MLKYIIDNLLKFMDLNKLKRLFPILLIVFIGLTIYYTNLSGNFWLTGWDNLHPEFNFKLNIGRAFYSSWQEYQGLGLPAGNGHAAEFFREIILVGLSLFTSLQSIRKIYLLFMLIAGPVGVFIFLKKIIFKESRDDLKSIFSLLGSLFYLLNIATVQIFYLPFEAFTTFYGIMPWMIFSIYNYSHVPTRKNLFFIILIHLVGSAQFFIPTLFIVYAVLLGIITSDLLKITNLKKIFKIYLVIFVSNLFWLLPFLYYSINNIGSQLNSYLNLLYSGDIYLKNVVYGGLFNSLLLKGFIFSTTDQISPQNYGYLMDTWRNYFANPIIIAIALILSLIFIIGIIDSIRKNTNRAFILIFLIFFSLIAIDTIPFNFLNEFLRKIPLFDQIFRNPYTKFANILLFVESIFFALGIQTFFIFFKDRLKKQTIYLIVGTILLLQTVVVLPIWQGNFIYTNFKLSIPNEYFELFEYFKNQGDGRIANFPQTSPNGWEIYNWGYRGSGFLWYGIKQPILDRAFDVWDKNSENYFWEIYKSTYSNNPINTRNVFKKYDVHWILVDNNIVGNTTNNAIDYDKFRELLNKISEIRFIKNFGNIDLYQFNSNLKEDKYITIVNDLPNVLPSYKWNDNDVAFNEFGPYLSAINDNSSNIYYPFRSIFTGRGNNEDGLKISEDDNNFVFTAKIITSFVNQQLVVPKFNLEEIKEYDKNDLLKTQEKVPWLFLDKQILTVKIPKIQGYYSFDSRTDNYLNSPLKNCDSFQEGFLDKKIIQQNQLKLTSLNSSNCFDIELPFLTHKNGYLLTIKSQNIEGKGLLFTLLNKTTNTIDLQTHLNSNNDLATQHFVVPPKDEYGLGYSLRFDNYSLGNKPVSNIFDSVKINPIPYDFLTTIKVIKNGLPVSIINNQIKINIIHQNYAHYDVNLSDKITGNHSTLILYQSYSPGWIAISNGKLLDHVLINNWANGWHLRQDSGDPKGLNITIIFWPQYLEFFGFGLLIFVLIFILKFPRS